MAQEIKVTTQLSCINGNFEMPKTGKQNAVVDQSVAGGMVPGVISIPTADTAITIGVTTLGWALIQNLDATNYIDFGPTSAGVIVPAIRLKPNEPAQVIRLVPGVSYRAQANTAACKLLLLVLEN